MVEICGILSIIDANVLNLLTDRRGVGRDEATRLYYNSDLYGKLEDEQTKLWHLSAETLYSLLDEELTSGKITYPEEQ